MYAFSQDGKIKQHVTTHTELALLFAGPYAKTTLHVLHVVTTKRYKEKPNKVIKLVCFAWKLG